MAYSQWTHWHIHSHARIDWPPISFLGRRGILQHTNCIILLNKQSVSTQFEKQFQVRWHWKTISFRRSQSGSCSLSNHNHPSPNVRNQKGTAFLQSTAQEFGYNMKSNCFYIPKKKSTPKESIFKHGTRLVKQPSRWISNQQQQVSFLHSTSVKGFHF